MSAYFNVELVAAAFLKQGAFVDMSPVWNGRAWAVNATDESGNSYAEAFFKTADCAQKFTDWLVDTGGKDKRTYNYELELEAQRITWESECLDRFDREEIQ